MELRIFAEPQQGYRYGDLVRAAQLAEELGFGGFFRSDHYLAIGSERPNSPGPTDAWVTLAGLARETERIRLGTLVTCATFRLPGVLAVTVAQVDEMSGGRIELGIGAGWYREEHVTYGVPFPDVQERFDRLEEQLAILSGMWRAEPGRTFSFSGRHYQIEDSPALPKPVQRPAPPIILGGKGVRRTPQLAARYASEFNIVFVPYEVAAGAFGRLDAALRVLGRPPSDVRRSVGLVCCCGKDQAQIEEREAAIRAYGTNLGGDWLRGTPAEIAGEINRYRDLGVSRVYLQILDLSDHDHIRLIADEVMPRCGADFGLEKL